ncbi:MAG: EI24 domain-containing protein [Rhodospirillales bacterium]|nr:EI24 domain-containing protein [Alphaproteobacteria bacterium]MBL6948422.1 EI24 domain-containing protein [Rhodospirillales bacterium]
MINAFSKGLAQLNDPHIRKVVWIAIAAAVIVFALLWGAVGTLLVDTSFFAILWLEWIADLFGGLMTLILTWFLFPAVISVVVGLFLEDIATAVEARHFPGLPPADGQTVIQSLMVTLRYLGVLVALNLVLLVFLLLGPVFPFVFYTVNGYLLGREYFELVALRRLGPDAARRLRLAHRWEMFLAGVVMAFLLTVPVVNLLAPIVITAAMVHLFEGWRKEAG